MPPRPIAVLAAAFLTATPLLMWWQADERGGVTVAGTAASFILAVTIGWGLASAYAMSFARRAPGRSVQTPAQPTPRPHRRRTQTPGVARRPATQRRSLSGRETPPRRPSRHR